MHVVHVNVTFRTPEAPPALNDMSESVDAYEHSAHVFLTGKLLSLFCPILELSPLNLRCSRP